MRSGRPWPKVGGPAWPKSLDQYNPKNDSLVHDEMQGYFDDRSEAWQERDRGMEHEQRITAIEQLLSDLEDLGL